MPIIQEYATLLRSVPAVLRKLYRDLENTKKKIINIEWSITFNNVCINENIVPDYVYNNKTDPAKSNFGSHVEYQRSLVKREIKTKEKTLQSLLDKKDTILWQIESFEVEERLKCSIGKSLDLILQNSDRAKKLGIIKKLNKLYNGQIILKNEINRFVNLSSHQLTSNEKEFLNLGFNYHIQPKYSKLHKQTELESLYNTLTGLENQRQIEMNPAIVTQLATEGTKHRNTPYKSTLRKELKVAAKDLKDNLSIVIRKADKSPIYVLRDRDEYLKKLNVILSDKEKFKLITKNPCEGLKQKANSLITALNAAVGDIHLQKIVGDYDPGYIYGNVKTHKSGNPLRPIISQIPTPTYNLAKSLNKIISPYIPNQYTIKSTENFLDILHNSESSGIIASLDVESLFTNVPVDKTIDIIINNVYSHPNLPPPKFPKNILKEMLILCTKESPFTAPDGCMYLQIEGVAMGSPLGPTFANFYMGELEKLCFQQARKPAIYVRFVDDIFLQVNDEDELIKLKELFENNSVLNFTYELSVDKKLPFLDVMVTSKNGNFNTNVYRKPTSIGSCLNANSECIGQYKDSVAFSFLNRAFKVSQTWHAFHEEVQHIKQMLVNNNYSNTKVDALINKFVNKKLTSTAASHTDSTDTIPIYYHNQTHGNCELDEKILKDIVYKNVKCCIPDKKIKLICYYKNIKTFNLVMKNNSRPKSQNSSRTNVVYQFDCPLPHSRAESYIGMTQATLNHRLINHAQAGSIFKHFREHHDFKPTRKLLLNNTSIIATAENRYKLAVKEALLILNVEPLINKQFDNFTNILKLYSHKKSNLRPEMSLPATKIEPLDTTPTTEVTSCNSELSRVDFNCLPVSHSTPNSSQQRTITSQIDNTYAHEKSNSTIDSIPDMAVVLAKFGIKNNFMELPLQDYLQKIEFGASDRSPENFTISQRIKTMVRAARSTNIVKHQPLDED